MQTTVSSLWTRIWSTINELRFILPCSVRFRSPNIFVIIATFTYLRLAGLRDRLLLLLLQGFLKLVVMTWLLKVTATAVMAHLVTRQTKLRFERCLVKIGWGCIIKLQFGLGKLVFGHGLFGRHLVDIDLLALVQVFYRFCLWQGLRFKRFY